tara:strand:+ start:431 stop:1174 length:744 start_codon:yes stop_codon:yes gene_type:complete
MLVSNKDIIVATPDNEIKMVTLRLEELNLSPLNPETRTKPKKLRRLKANLEKHGQLTPIIVKRIKTTTKNDSQKGSRKHEDVLRVVDGHRRAHCLSELGHKTIKALIIKNEANYDETFTALHADTMKISTVQECERWLKGAKSISNRVTTLIGEMQRALGRNTTRQVISRCVESETSPGTLWAGMKKYRAYTGRKSRAQNKEIAYWLLNISTVWMMIRAIDSFIPIELLTESIDNKVPIPPDWAIRD